MCFSLRSVLRAASATAFATPLPTRCTKIFSHHKGPVTCLLRLNDQTLVSGSESTDRTVVIRDLKTEKWSVFGNPEGLSSVSAISLFSPNLFVSGGMKHAREGIVPFYDIVKKAALFVLGPHAENVSSVITLPGARIASGSWDGRIKIWDPKLGSPLCGEINLHHSIQALALVRERFIACGSSTSPGVTLWDASNCEPIGDPLPHDGPVHALTVTNDYRKLVTGGDDKIVRVWDFSEKKPRLISATLTSSEIRSLTVLPDRNTIACGHLSNAISYVDATAQKVLQELPKYHKGQVNTLAYIGDSLFSGSNDTTIRCWEP